MKVTEVWSQLSSSTIDKMSAINAFESRDKFTKDTDLDVETLKHLVKINLVITKKDTEDNDTFAIRDAAFRWCTRLSANESATWLPAIRTPG